MSRECCRAVAETIIAKDDKDPGFWADLLAEVARLQADRRRARQEESSPADGEVAAPQELEATGETTREADAEASLDPPQAAEEKARAVTPRPQGSVELEGERSALVPSPGRLWDPPPKGAGGAVDRTTSSGSAPGEERTARSKFATAAENWAPPYATAPTAVRGGSRRAPMCEEEGTRDRNHPVGEAYRRPCACEKTPSHQADSRRLEFFFLLFFSSPLSLQSRKALFFFVMSMV
ncbi:hypothetical protein RF55_21595 [Lasius niger]|uniref:Uncharacterized protein n=1 Tax=Lasius niger TaxID=67767 RepID=A0A0J7JYB0_LASNI|nr:hypothetical protein RF55_21595 [Lasius niger]